MVGFRVRFEHGTECGTRWLREILDSDNGSTGNKEKDAYRGDLRDTLPDVVS
ncbi:hypothetical protein LNA02_13830 [Levilactobacillus namurensis]|nr:hypothetical protein LNA02_13830 [Levilactobacillus namurensis]